MNSIPERIENGGVFLRNFRVEFPDVRFGDDDVFGEGAIGIDADDFHVLADVSFAGAALQALAACHVHLGGNEIAFLDAGHFVAERNHFATEFVPRDQRRVDASCAQRSHS